MWKHPWVWRAGLGVAAVLAVVLGWLFLKYREQTRSKIGRLKKALQLQHENYRQWKSAAE